MELRPPPGLVWIDEIVPRCLFTDEPLEVREAEVEFVGLGEPPDPILLAWSEGAGCWYALLDTLIEWCGDSGIAPADAAPFRIDGLDQTAAVHFVEPGLTMPWDDFVARIDDAKRRSTEPPPSNAEVAPLPQLPETWQLAVGEGGVITVEGEPLAMAVAVVVDASGQPRGATMIAPPVTAEALAGAVRSATSAPTPTLTSARPREVVVDDAALAEAMGEALAPVGIAVRHAATALADEVLEDLQTSALGTTRPLAPLFADASDDDLRAFLKAATAFYRAAPWKRLRGDSFIAVQDQGLGPDSPWLYVSVMGQMDDQPGLSLFSRWMDVCALVHDGGMAVVEAGAHLKGVTLLPPQVLDSAEADRLMALGAAPLAGGQLPTVTRMGSGTMNPSSYPLPLVTAMLTAIRETVANRRAKTITSIKATVEAEGCSLALRYPARGDEGLAKPARGVRLTITGRDDPDGYTVALGREDQLVIEGPANASAYVVGRAIRHAYEEADRWGFVTAFLADGTEVWNGRAYATDPGPTLDDLATAPNVELLLAMVPYRVEAERLPTSVPDLRAELS